MKRILLFVPLFFIFSCNNSTKSLPKPFSAEMLAAQLFSIDPTRDTSLQTLHGSLVRIPAGAFNVSGKVDIEIREAFTPAEILAAGLTTESNGRPLRSGGMIYINATSGDDSVQLIKPLKVSIPNNVYDSAMQVFKGEPTDSAGINWVDPQPTDTTPQSRNWQNGKALFESTCASCHRVFTSLTGPALGEADRRWPDRTKLYEWIWNSEKLVVSGYPKAVEISKFSASAMTPFEGALTKTQIDDILFYINNEYNDPAARLREQHYSDSMQAEFAARDSAGAADIFIDSTVNTSCGNDTVYVGKPKLDQTFLNPIMATEENPAEAEDVEYLRKGFTDPNPTAGMYDFEIRTLGWYNIDAYVEGYEGTVITQVRVKLALPVESAMHVYLFCPTDKTLSVGMGNLNDPSTYHFTKINGGIPLFLRQPAIIFVFGSYKDKMYSGVAQFTVKREQTINVTVKETTEEEIRRVLTSRRIEGIDLGIEKKEMKVVERDCDPKPDTTLKL